jgi:GMP synthase-like glutamine amidotransferase
MRIGVTQHEVCEGPGEIANWAGDRGHSVEVAHLYRGDPVPSVDALDALVVMGGEMNIHQYRQHPWLKPERLLVEAAMAQGKPVIGICLGAQVIADALGARVAQNPVYEIGWFPIAFTPEAHARFPKLPASATVLHWHGDTFDLPPGSTRIATSEACPEQGFAIPGKCLGLQFHLEMDPDLVRQTVKASIGPWPNGPYVQTPEHIFENAATYSEKNRLFLYDLLDAFMVSFRG